MVRIGGSAFKAINTVARTQQTLNKVKVLVVKSYVVLCNPKCYSLLGSSVHGILQAWILGRRGGGCHFLLQGIFLTQGSNACLLHCRHMLYHLSHQRTITGEPLTKTTVPGQAPQ